MEKTSQTKNSKQHDRLYIVKSTLIYFTVYIFRTSRLNQDKTKQNKTNTNKVR